MQTPKCGYDSDSRLHAATFGVLVLNAKRLPALFPRCGRLVLAEKRALLGLQRACPVMCRE